MLNIVIKINANNDAEYIMRHDTESYKDPFVNNKTDVYMAILNTADKLGFLSKESSFKSLEFISHDETKASVIYNRTKLVELEYDPEYDTVYICGVRRKANSDNLSSVFLLKDVVKDVEH